MGTAYARSVQEPTGRMQARDLAAGDTILIRRPESIERTAETILDTKRDGNDVILDTKRDGNDVILYFDGWHHRTSPTMTVALAAGRN